MIIRKNNECFGRVCSIECGKTYGFVQKVEFLLCRFMLIDLSDLNLIIIGFLNQVVL